MFAIQIPTIVATNYQHLVFIIAERRLFLLQFAYSSGVDPVLMEFQPVVKNNSVDSRRKWVKSIHRTVNTHDVRALACFDKKASSKRFTKRPYKERKKDE